ncbi:MAG TPA: RHS repeat-associated core domain-containing protein, partial [Flavobacteriaceae bacterium]|nr:RHS repeat-associated core domain-containing protein [Flavobacteriaceae bacterium]
NEKVDIASEILETTYAAFDKGITLPQPFYYETRMILACDVSPIPGAYAPFWYHPDHLGSSSYITNLDGEINQHMEYLPFGETLVEEHLNSYNSPFKFNAKELDAETGNYYYGARYYDPKWSLWISVDPLWEKYPSWSPFAYTFQNSINFIDPDGRSGEPVIDNENKTVTIWIIRSKLTPLWT